LGEQAVINGVVARPLAPKHRRTPWLVPIGGLVTFAAGVAAILAAYSMARRSTSSAHFTVFWLGLALVLAATAVVGLRARRGVVQLAVLVAYGVATFVPKYVMSRNGPVFFDEFGHIRHANDIAATGHLNVASAYLPVMRVYPGLEVLTAWLHDLTGASTWHVGQVVVLLAHCGSLLLVWWLARQVGLSSRASFLAALVFSLNPSFLYFDTEFSYESLGLPLCFAAIAMTIAAHRAGRALTAAGWCIGATAAVGACIVTHHVSAAVMVLLLAIVAVTAAIGPRAEAVNPVARWGPAAVAGLAAAGFVLWLVLVAPSTIGYIEPHVRNGLHGVVEIVTGRSASGHTSARHQLFSGSNVPPYEKVFAYLAPLLAGFGTLGAVVQALRDRHRHARLLAIAPFLVLAILYFVSLPLALTVDGGETAHRAWAYTYLGIAVCMAYGAPSWRLIRPPGRAWLGLVVGLGALMATAIGNVAAGENVLYRFPGPYQFGTDTRSQTPELRELAAWAAADLPVGAKIVTDRFTGEVMTADTRLSIPSPSESRAYGLYREGDGASPSLRDFLAVNGFSYWILDTRIETQQPVQKFFQGYAGPVSINVAALRAVGVAQSTFLVPVHVTAHYLVLAIQP
jgi:hypothetical protein